MKRKNEPTYQVRAVERAFDILKSFTVNKPELSLTELSEMTELHKSTIIRILDVLQHHGYIEQNKENDKYSLGMGSFEVGMVYFHTKLRINHVAKPLMIELVNKVNFTLNLAILEGSEIVYIGIEEPPNKVLRFNFSLGSRNFVHCTALGKVLASTLSDERIDQIVNEKKLPKVAKNTITNLEDFKKHLKLVREQEYAEDIEETLDGVRCIASPIYDYSGRVVAALSISGAIFEIDDEKAKKLLKELQKTTNEISQKLGYQLRTSYLPIY